MIKLDCKIDGITYENCAIIPFKFQDVLDATLDSAVLELGRVRKEIFEPLTDIGITLTSNGSLGAQTYETDWLVSTSESYESPVGSGLYHHSLSLIEETKYLEGFISDSICVTHSGGNIYTNNAKPVTPEESEG